MADYNHYYGTAVDVRPSPVERALAWLIAQITAWAEPKLRKIGKFFFAELVRGSIALAFLGFALVAAIYGGFYLLDFTVETLSNWLPHWVSVGIVASVLLVPAGIAAVIGLWQVAKMKTVRTGVAILAQFAAVLWTLTRGKPRETETF